MRYATLSILAFGLGMTLTACAPENTREADTVAEASEEAINTLTPAEEAEGWRLLFDGETFDGWRGLGRDEVPTQHWVIQDGTIHKIPADQVPVQADGQPLEGGDLMTVDTFENFELTFEWKISEAGNSGVKYNVSEEMSTSYDPPYAALGFEYQILDDQGHPDAQNGPTRMAGALYDIFPPSEDKVLMPVGEWNKSRIVFRGLHGEHWLNGVKVVEFDLDSPEFREAFEASKYRDIPNFAEKRAGHIVLQDHIDAVWFRNLKIRELPAS